MTTVRVIHPMIEKGANYAPGALFDTSPERGERLQGLGLVTLVVPVVPLPAGPDSPPATQPTSESAPGPKSGGELTSGAGALDSGRAPVAPEAADPKKEAAKMTAVKKPKKKGAGKAKDRAMVSPPSGHGK